MLLVLFCLRCKKGHHSSCPFVGCRLLSAPSLTVHISPFFPAKPAQASAGEILGVTPVIAPQVKLAFSFLIPCKVIG